jgi:hypothetical protein
MHRKKKGSRATLAPKVTLDSSIISNLEESTGGEAMRKQAGDAISKRFPQSRAADL